VREEAVERLIAHDEVSDTVLAPSCQSDEPMIVVPVANPRRQLQLGVRARERTADIALGAHVKAEGRQSGKQLARAIETLQPVPAFFQQVKPSLEVHPAGFVNSVDGQYGAKARKRSGESVLRGARLSHPTDALSRLLDQSREGRLRHAQLCRQLGPSSKPASPQDCEQMIQRRHESILNRYLNRF
jgi:hypothetical protein